MDALEYLRTIRRRWPVVAAAAALAVAGAWLTMPEAPASPGVTPARQYTADHVLYRDGSARGEQQVRLETVALLASSGEVPRRVAEELGEDGEPALLAAEVTITGDDNLGTVTISTRQEDPERAVRLVDAFGKEIVAHFDGQAEAQRMAQIDQLRERVDEMEQEVLALGQQLPGERRDDQSASVALRWGEFEAVLSQRNATITQLEQLQSAGPASIGLRTLQSGVPIPVMDEEGAFQPPTSPRSRVGIGALLGLALGVGLAMMVDRVDTRLRDRRTAEQTFGLPVVAEIPRLRAAQRRNHSVVVASQPASLAAEAYRVLRLAVQLMPRWILPVPNPSSTPESDALTPRPTLTPRTTAEPARVVLVTSPTAGAGKSTTVANLAATFAEIGKVVLVLDCDFRYPQVHRFFNVDPEPGVTEFLHPGGERPALAALARETPMTGVWVVPAGAPPANPGELVGPEQELISAAAELADIVLVDTGPLLAVNDPAALMPRADAVVVVARSGKTTVDEAARASELLARLEAPVLGVALVGGPAQPGSAGRYYSRRRVRPLEAPTSLHERSLGLRSVQQNPLPEEPS